MSKRQYRIDIVQSSRRDPFVTSWDYLGQEFIFEVKERLRKRADLGNIHDRGDSKDVIEEAMSRETQTEVAHIMQPIFVFSCSRAP